MSWEQYNESLNIRYKQVPMDVLILSAYKIANADDKKRMMAFWGNIISHNVDEDVATMLSKRGYPFGSFLMAMAMDANENNLAHLTLGWPELVNETRDRYNLPGGRYPDEIEKITKIKE